MMLFIMSGFEFKISFFFLHSEYKVKKMNRKIKE